MKWRRKNEWKPLWPIVNESNVCEENDIMQE